MLKALWQKVSRKATSTSRALRRPSTLPRESEKSMKEKLRSSQQAKIYETSSSLGGVAMLLSNEKSRLSRALNEHLRISRRLLELRVIPNTMTSRRNSRMIESDMLMGNLLFARRNIVEGITTRLKRWRSSQSSCEKDNCSKKSPRCIEDHQQSAESCGKTIEKCSDGHQTSAECRPGSCSDLLSHQEYYRSIESGCPIYSRKPARYNDRRACDSLMYDSTTRDSRECSQSEIDDADVRRVIFSKRWTTGKSATEGEIHRQCRLKLCSSPYRSNREEDKCSPSYTLPDCSKEKTEDVGRDELSRPVCISQQCPKSEPSCPEKIRASMEKEAPCVGDTMSRKHPIPDPYEDQTKPDPPPPRQQHWTENLPAYCEYCVRKTRKSIVEPSPMMFVPHRESRKSRTKDAKIPCSASNADRNGIDAKTKVTRAMPRSQESLPQKSAEDKCVDSLTFPVAINATKPKAQLSPTLTKSGSCCAKKEFVISDVSDCKPNVASLKYRLSKCPCIKEMWKIADQESQVDINKARRKRRVPSSHTGKTKKPRRETAKRRKGKRIESRNGWTRQRYKVRLRIFQKRNEQLDPSPIAELRQPRCEQARSSKLPLKSTVRGAELSPRLGSPRPSDYCPAERPLVEHKSYPTKMDECRTARDEGSQKCNRKKRC
ncbi:uncharacterized protein LOC116843790 [Odontomachus brunneus]|uniref:uncharacterized protein LOC116843790 n=1 Tax=Odontomachus brunneus TaxID=486640 RepID=UPI0013F1B57C|nr:uncharacterized protein LOC116843790 [Odontomachus brunneus]